MPGSVPNYPIILTPEPEASLQHLRTCYTAPFAAVQRARVLLRAPQRPPWGNAEIVQPFAFGVNPVKRWRTFTPPERTPANSARL